MVRQTEKSARTRRALIDATFECLVELGYPGTTTVAVCARSGLARGTMLHHFPTKQALVLAALEDVLERRTEDFRAELSRLEEVDLAALVRHLWAAVRGPTFYAWLELAVASRTDPVLESEFRAVMARFDRLVVAVTEATLPPDAAGEFELHTAVSLVFTALNGLALDLLQNSPESVESKAEMLVQWVSRYVGGASA